MLLKFQTKFCSMININKVCFVMGEVQKKMSGSFNVSWHIPSAAVSYVVKFTRNIFPSFYQEYKITSLTLDGMRGLIWAVKLLPQTHPFLLPLPSAQWTNMCSSVDYLDLHVWVCVGMCGYVCTCVVWTSLTTPPPHTCNTRVYLWSYLVCLHHLPSNTFSMCTCVHK